MEETAIIGSCPDANSPCKILQEQVAKSGTLVGEDASIPSYKAYLSQLMGQHGSKKRVGNS